MHASTGNITNRDGALKSPWQIAENTAASSALTQQVFDYPCHDGRFNIDGSVITSPPTKALQTIKYI